MKNWSVKQWTQYVVEKKKKTDLFLQERLLFQLVQEAPEDHRVPINEYN